MTHAASDEKEKAIFHAARSIRDTVQRETYLQAACGGDSEVRELVDALLAAAGDGSFMEQPAAERCTTDQSPQASEAVGTNIGNYKLLQQIGEGGFGVVYMAEQEQPVRRRVALKIIKLGMDTRQVIARFEVERQALAMMDHPNIAKVLDAGATETGRPYFVMELVRGVPITQFCDENHLSTEERLIIFADVCSAIQHAHQKGIIHRDIKPSNVMITMHDDRAVPKVIDFGVAKATEHRLTEKTLFTTYAQMIGTPAYMSPEQAQMSGLDVDTRSDIYSLGVLLYELLVGRPPFDPKELRSCGYEEMCRRIREEEPVKPSTRLSTLTDVEETAVARHRHCDRIRLIRQLHGDLDWIVMKALEKDRTRRYETASAFRQDVQRFLDDDPVTAVAPSMAYRLRKFASRNKLIFAAVSAIAAALLLGITIASWQAIRANHSARLADHKTQEAILERNQKMAALERETQQREVAEANLRRAQKERFASAMALVQRAIQDLDAKLAFDILDSLSADPGLSDLRAWFWRYLRGQLAREERMVRAFTRAHELAVSPDGLFLAVGGGVGKWNAIRVLSLPDLDVRQTLRLPQDAPWIAGMAFSSDTSKLVVECQSAPVGVVEFDLVTDVMKSLSPENQRNRVLRLTPDRRWLVGMTPQQGNNRLLRCFDRETGLKLKESKPFTTPNRLMIDHEMRISPDGSLVTVSCADKVLRIFSLPELEEVRAISTPDDVAVVAWSSDGKLLATGYDELSLVDLWKVETGERTTTLSADFIGACLDLSFSPDGTKLAACDWGTVVTVWDTNTRKRIRTFPGHRAANMGSLVFLPDNITVASVGGAGRVKLWDVSPPERTELQQLNEVHRFSQIAYSPDGKLLATIGSDRTVRLFDTKKEALRRSLPPPKPVEGRVPLYSQTPQLAFSSDGRTLVAGHGGSSATAYDVDSGISKFVLDEHSSPLINVLISPDDQLIATSEEDDVVTLWEVETGTKVMQMTGSRYIDFHPDPHSRILAVADRNAFYLLDIETGEQVSIVSGSPRSVRFSDDGETLAVGMLHEVRLYSVPELDLVRTINGPRGPVTRVEFHPDGNTLVIPGWGGLLQVWSAKAGRIVGRLPVPADMIVAARFSPGGDTLAASTRESGLHLFHAPPMSEIDRWQEEERLDSERLGTLARGFWEDTEKQREDERTQREQRFANDSGSINRWLLLGPVPLRGQHFADESGLEPKEGEQARVHNRIFAWQAKRRRDPVFDFLEIYSAEKPDGNLDYHAVYAVTYVVSDRMRERLRVKIGSDDQSVLYVNGREVHRNLTRRRLILDQDVAGIRLQRGINRLVFRVDNYVGSWAGSVRLTDAEGQPVQGIRVTLDPEGVAGRHDARPLLTSQYDG